MCRGHSFFLLLLLTAIGSKGRISEGYCPTTKRVASVGAVFNYNSCVGKEQKVPVYIALQDLHRLNCSNNLVLKLKDSHGNSARAISAAIDLIDTKQVQTIIGTLTLQEAALISDICKTTKDVPILSLTSPAINFRPIVPLQPTFFIQMVWFRSISKGLGAMLWFSVTVLFFVQREPIKSHLSRLVLAPWFLVILIVTASFTAGLTSSLTVSHFKPSVVDIETLQKTNAKVGCNQNSFIFNYLITALKFKPENIRTVHSMKEYPEAFQRGHITAAFFTAPHAKVFVAKYCNYTAIEPIVNLGGLGFVFPKGSPLTTDISKAILEVTQSGRMRQLENDMLSSNNCSGSASADQNDNPELGPEPFYNLFCISGAISAVALLITIVRLMRRWRNIMDNE